MVAALRFRAKLAGKKTPVGSLTERVLAGFRRQGVGRGCGQVTGVGWAQSDAAAALAALRSSGSGLGLAGLTETPTLIAVVSDQEGAGAVLYLGKANPEAGSEVVGGLWARSWTTFPESLSRWGGRRVRSLSPGDPSDYQGQG